MSPRPKKALKIFAYGAGAYVVAALSFGAAVVQFGHGPFLVSAVEAPLIIGELMRDERSKAEALCRETRPDENCHIMATDDIADFIIGKTVWIESLREDLRFSSTYRYRFDLFSQGDYLIISNRLCRRGDAGWRCPYVFGVDAGAALCRSGTAGCVGLSATPPSATSTGLKPEF